MKIKQIISEGMQQGVTEVFKHNKETGTTHKGGVVTKTSHGIKHTKNDYDDGHGVQGAKSSGKESKYKQTPILDIDDADDLEEGETWAKHNNPRAGGMSKKSVNSYRRSHPGSKIQTAVTTKPSKLKKGSKAAKRRKSFCARMKGMKKSRTSAKTARDPNSNINKSLRRWNCESVEQMQELVMIAEQFIAKHKK
jgi:hypothetical protein